MISYGFGESWELIVDAANRYYIDEDPKAKRLFTELREEVRIERNNAPEGMDIYQDDPLVWINRSAHAASLYNQLQDRVSIVHGEMIAGQYKNRSSWDIREAMRNSLRGTSVAETARKVRRLFRNS